MARSVTLFFLKQGVIFGFVPWIDFDKFELVDHIHFKIYHLVIAIIIIVFGVVRISYFEKVTYFLDVFFTINLLGMSTRSIFFKRHVWKKWMKVYHDTNFEIKSKLGLSMEIEWKFIYFFISYIVFFIAVRLILHYYGSGIHIFMSDIILYIIISMEYLSIVILFNLVKGFKILNKYSRILIYDNRLHLEIRAKIYEHKIVFCRKLYENLYQLATYSQELFHLLFSTLLIRLLILLCSLSQFLTNNLLYKPADVVLHVLLPIISTFSAVSENFIFIVIKYYISNSSSIF